MPVRFFNTLPNYARHTEYLDDAVAYFQGEEGYETFLLRREGPGFLLVVPGSREEYYELTPEQAVTWVLEYFYDISPRSAGEYDLDDVYEALGTTAERYLENPPLSWIPTRDETDEPEFDYPPRGRGRIYFTSTHVAGYAMRNRRNAWERDADIVADSIMRRLGCTWRTRVGGYCGERQIAVCDRNGQVLAEVRFWID